MQSIPSVPRADGAPERPSAFADRAPPFSAEAEIAVLGGMLIDADAVVRAVELVDDSMFHAERNRRIFRAMLRVWQRGDAVEPVGLAEELRNVGDLEAVGGMQYLASLMDAVPTAANLEYHARIVREKALVRRLIEQATSIIQDAYSAGGEVDELLDQAEQRIFQIAQSHERKGFVWIKEILWPTFERIEQLQQNSSAVTGVPSGFPDLDELTAGFQPGDLVIVAARPSMGKCLAADAELVLEDGSVRTIEEVVRDRAGRVATLREDWRLGWAEPSAFVDDGEKPVFRVTTRLGRRVTTTLTHPFLTLGGWRRLGDLDVGDRIAVPRRIDACGDRPMRPCEVKLLGYLLGDGGLTGINPRFTNADPRLRDEFAEAVAEFGGIAVTEEDSGGRRTPTLNVRRDTTSAEAVRREVAAGLRAALGSERGAARRLAEAVSVSPASVSHWTGGASLPSAATLERACGALGVEPEAVVDGGLDAVARCERNPLRAWLDEIGLWGRGAAEKHVPAPVFRLPRPQLALFLNRLFATDGWATVLASGQPQVGYASASERLARQVQHLLLRFGVVAKLRRRRVRYDGGVRHAWQLDVTDPESLRVFAGEVGIFGKEEAVRRVAAALAARGSRARRDSFPPEVWAWIDRARGGESWASLARRAGLAGWSNIHVGQRSLTRDRLRALAEALDDAGLRDLAAGDVWWDEIVEVEPLGVRRVYDLTVPGTHNFVADDVCVHNTAFTLNVAQHAAISAQKAVAFFSLEMSKESLVQRILCAEGRVDASRLRRGRLLDDEYARLATAAGYLNTAPIYIDDTPGISLLEMRAKARRLKADREDLSMIIVDYLQLMTGNGRSENRQQEVSEISRGLKALAKELDVPVIALSQLSRAVESRPDKRPMMSDLRESGAIEQDADVITFLYRPEYYYGPTDKEGNSLEGRAELIVGKQRNGATGTVNLMFLKEFTRFESYSPRGDDGGGF